MSSAPNLIQLQGPLWQVINLDPCTAVIFGLLVTLDLVHMNLQRLVQSDDLTCEENKVGVAAVDETVELSRAGSGEVAFEFELRVEAGFDAMIVFGGGTVLIAERVVDVVVALQTEGSGGVVTAGGATARLGAGSGNGDVVGQGRGG